MSRFKAWYIPQIPMKAFEVERDTAAEAKAALDLITDFSIFEYDNKIKPDYADVGGVMEWDDAESDWIDYEPDEPESTACHNGNEDCYGGNLCFECWHNDRVGVQQCDHVDMSCPPGTCDWSGRDGRDG